MKHLSWPLSIQRSSGFTFWRNSFFTTTVWSPSTEFPPWSGEGVLSPPWSWGLCLSGPLAPCRGLFNNFTQLIITSLFCNTNLKICVLFLLWGLNDNISEFEPVRDKKVQKSLTWNHRLKFSSGNVYLNKTSRTKIQNTEYSLWAVLQPRQGRRRKRTATCSPPRLLGLTSYLNELLTFYKS